MPIAIICTGTELLKGGCCNTDLYFAGAELARHAMPPVMEICIGDHPQELCCALADSLKQADILIISGGLGPTTDDITLETVARFFGVKTIEVPELKEKVRKCWAMRHNSRCPEFQYKQAMIVENGKYFDNPAGVASGIGFQVEYNKKLRRIFLLPGPPAEFETVFHNGVLDEIITASDKKTYTSGFFICGIGEVMTAKTVEPMFTGLPLEIAYTAAPAGTKLFLSSEDPQLLDAAVQKAKETFGPAALDRDCFDLPAALLRKLSAAGLTLGCAESCTGGIIADTIVSIPGASDVFKGGIISYANSVKINTLGVSEEIIAGVGAVSADCASAMVQGACRVLGCNCAVSTTGIAGPDGGTPEKPVGLVYVAASVNGLSTVKELRLHGNRKMIRERAAANALQLLWQLLNAPENAVC